MTVNILDRPTGVHTRRGDKHESRLNLDQYYHNISMTLRYIYYKKEMCYVDDESLLNPDLHYHDTV